MILIHDTQSPTTQFLGFGFSISDPFPIPPGSPITAGFYLVRHQMTGGPYNPGVIYFEETGDFDFSSSITVPGTYVHQIPVGLANLGKINLLRNGGGLYNCNYGSSVQDFGAGDDIVSSITLTLYEQIPAIARGGGAAAWYITRGEIVRRTAFVPEYVQLTGITSFPVGYQYVSAQHANFLFISPGLFEDNNTCVNGQCVIRLYDAQGSSQATSPGQQIPNYRTPNVRPFATILASNFELVPLPCHDKVNIIVEIDRADTPVSQTCELTLTPYWEG